MENINLEDLDNVTLVELLESLEGLDSVLDEIEGELGNEEIND